MEPAAGQGAGGVFGQAPVAVHQQVAADQDLAVVGDAAFDAWQGGADGVDAGAQGGDGRDYRACFGLAVALHHGDAEALEEAADLGLQAGAAADDGAQSAAEAGADFAADDALEQRVDQAFPGGEGEVLGAFAADGDGAVEQLLLPLRLTRDLGEDAAADHFEHAGDHRHDGGADGDHVDGEVFDAAGVDDFGAGDRQEEAADGVFVGVRERQEGEVDLALRVQRAQQFVGAAAVGDDGAVRQHDAAGRAGGAGGVDDDGEGACGDFGGFLGDVGEIEVLGDHRLPVAHIDAVELALFHADQQIEPAGLFCGGGHLGCQRRGGDDGGGGAAVSEHVGVIRHRVGGVGGHRHGADRLQGHFGDGEFRSVLAYQQHAIAGLNAGGAQGAGHGGDADGEAEPAHPPPTALPRPAQQGPIVPITGEGEHHRGYVRPARHSLHCFSPF